MEEEAVDVAAVVEGLKSEVQRRRQNGEYPPGLENKLDAEFHADDMALPPEALAQIQSARPIPSAAPIRFIKKVVRRFLAWYVDPIARDQTQFNVAASRDLRALERRIAAIEESLKSR